MLMHLEYKVRLPDHDWSVGSRHKLTPSVYAAVEVKDNCMGQKEAVTYSGPTYIAIRSCKHSSSTASTHAKDLDKLYSLPDFDPILKGEDGKAKPVHMISVDGGPDENPRYKKVIAHGITHFINRDLDALFVYTNAPGNSAFNEVERRLAHLSKRAAGLVLQHNHYGNHLDGNGRTIDKELELSNFRFAGETLAEVWSELTFDGFGVTAEFVPSDEVLPNPLDVSDEWYANHVRESQYLLQVIFF